MNSEHYVIATGEIPADLLAVPEENIIKRKPVHLYQTEITTLKFTTDQIHGRETTRRKIASDKPAVFISALPYASFCKINALEHFVFNYVLIHLDWSCFLHHLFACMLQRIHKQ